MKPRIHVITLAVADLDRALAFYRDGLGFRTEGLIGTEFKGDEATPDGTTGILPRSRRPPLGDYLESRARPRPVLSGRDPSGASTGAGQRHGSRVRGGSSPRNPCLLAASFVLNGCRAAG